MPMKIEGNRFVFFHEFEILLHENEDISHGSFHFCIPKANNASGYIYISGMFKTSRFLFKY